MSPEIRIANPISGPGWTSAKRARKLCAKGRAHMKGDVLWLNEAVPRQSAPERRVKPICRARLDITEHWLRDLSGGSARYPMPLQTSIGPRFPGLARANAGL